MTKHVLIPKHVKISDKEKKEVLDKYEVTVKGLPKININDPALAELGVAVGDVIKIVRKSPTRGEATYYRGVVDE